MTIGSENNHEMVITQSFEDGSQEWYCPVCGRRFIMQWPPAYSKVVLDPGDEHATHTGGTGGLTLSAAELTDAPLEASFEAQEIPAEESEDPYLAPFLQFLEERQDLDGPTS